MNGNIKPIPGADGDRLKIGEIMIIENITYSLQCDGEGCNNYFDGEDQRSEASVISDAEDDDWMVDGVKCYCPDHRPGVERED
jgi:hypothetical protein